MYETLAYQVLACFIGIFIGATWSYYTIKRVFEKRGYLDIWNNIIEGDKKHGSNKK